MLGEVAQSVEQGFHTPCVEGSSPSLATIQYTNAVVAQLVEHDTFNVGVTGSNPVSRTTLMRV